MKKTILTIAIAIYAFVSNAQNLKVQSNIGISTAHFKDYSIGWNMVNFIGFEFEDKIGLEYGYSYSLNTNTQELYNYLYGSSQKWSAGHFNHLMALYYKTKREDGNCINIGGGISVLTTYEASDIVLVKNKVSPYLKVGLDNQFHKNWGFQINSAIGKVFAFTCGLTYKL